MTYIFPLVILQLHFAFFDGVEVGPVCGGLPGVEEGRQGGLLAHLHNHFLAFLLKLSAFFSIFFTRFTLFQTLKTNCRERGKNKEIQKLGARGRFFVIVSARNSALVKGHETFPILWKVKEETFDPFDGPGADLVNPWTGNGN